jgi:hypothetical protein
LVIIVHLLFFYGEIYFGSIKQWNNFYLMKDAGSTEELFNRDGKGKNINSVSNCNKTANKEPNPTAGDTCLKDEIRQLRMALSMVFQERDGYKAEKDKLVILVYSQGRFLQDPRENLTVNDQDSKRLQRLDEVPGTPLCPQLNEKLEGLSKELQEEKDKSAKLSLLLKEKDMLLEKKTLMIDMIKKQINNTLDGITAESSQGLKEGSTTKVS